ncbi:fibrillin-2 [Platysternon megacephalum]|uniref:Fibrillin-2 n=1 Tax=Platysternon megacephalum TaxID=55544 RepID=A0A4D9E0A4_9SAUR|nr:fibrillin-2 [Platysternon megacephalum]
MQRPVPYCYGVPQCCSSERGQVFNGQVHLDLVKSSPHVTKAEERANRPLQESQQVKPELGLPWMLVYVPVRSCHRVLKEKLGEFSPPTYNHFQLNIWCNWTIWAGSRKHIIIYIKGFMTDEDCDKNEDKILFQGVSSLVENTVVYACWNKKIHVFATYARAVHVVFLMKYSSNPKNKYFKGKYYIFKHRDIDSSSEDIIVSQAPIPKSKKTSHSTPRSNKIPVIYHGKISDDTNISTASSTENLNKNLNKTTVLDNTGLQVGGEGQNVAVLESSLQLIPQHGARTQLLKPEAQSLLESLNLSTSSMDKEKSLGIGKSFGRLPQTVAPDIWELRPSECEVLVDFSQVYRPKSLPGFLSEIPYLSVSHLIEPLKSMALEGPESEMSFLLASLKQTNTGDLQLNINPTSLSYPVLASYSHSVAHDRVETIGDKNIGSTPSQSLSRVTLVKDENLLQSNILAYKVMSSHGDSLVTGSLPSLRMTSQDQVVLGDQSQPETRGMDKAGSYQISSTQRVSGDKSVTELDLRTTTLKNINPLDDSVLESSMEVIDQPKIRLITAAPYGLSDGEHHLKLQSCQHVDSASTELESILPSTEVSLHLAVSEVLYLGMKSSQQVGLVTGLEPVPSTEVSLPPAASELELIPSTETSLPVLLTELEPVIPFPHTEPSLPPPASELGPLLFPSAEVSLPVFPTETEPVTSALEPVAPFLSTEPSLPPATSELRPVPFPGTEVTFPLAAMELEPVIPSREASLPPAALKNEFHLRTKSSHYIDTDTELDHIHRSTTVLLHPAAQKEDLLEGEPPSKPHSDCYGAPAATEHRHALPSTTQSLNFFLQERKIGVQQSILKGEREESIHEAETAQPGKAGERNLITNFFTGNFFSDTTQLQALKPEPELGLLGSEGHTSKLSPVTEYLAKTPLVVTRTNRVKQNELMFKNGLMTSSTRATPPLERTAMNTKVKLTEPVKETSNTTLKQIFPDTTKHHEVQQTTEWSSDSRSSATAYSNGLTPAKKLALKESIDSHPVQSSSARTPENASTSEARVLLNYIVPELPWLLLYLPIRSCHVTLKDEIGTFSPPARSGIQTNIWCNWTIWAGPQKHILIYIKGFQGKEDCDENPDKIIFQGVLSSVERKVVYACKNQGTLIFATQALAVHVVFLSKGNSLNHERKYFKGQYYVFEDYETSRSTNDTAAPQEPVKKTTRKTKYGSIRFYPKSPIKHYRGLLDFVKTSTAHNENQLLNKLPTLDKEGWGKNGSSTKLETFLRFVLGNNTRSPLLKAMDNMTFSTHDLKWQRFMKSLGNENSREEKRSDFPMVTPALNILRLNSQNEKEQTIAFGKLMDRPTIHSNLLSETLHFKEPMKSVEMRSVKTTKSVGPQHSSAALWRPANMEDLQPAARQAVHRPLIPPHGLQSLQGTWEEQNIRTTSSQSFRAAPIKDREVLQSNRVNDERVASHPAAFVEDFQSNAGLSGDGQEVTGQLQHVMNLERSIKESQMEHQTHTKENDKGDLYVKPASALKNVKLNVEPLTLGTPKKVLKTESILVTVALHNTLDVSSSYHAETTATEFKPVLPSSTRSGLLGKTAAATAHLDTPVTKDTEPPLIMSTKSPPSYASSGGVSKDTASLKREHEKDSFDMASIFTYLENDTMLESQHNPGDVLFEVTSEIEHKGWIPRSGDELKKALMESIKLHIQKNLKLLVSKVNEIKLKEIKRTNDLKPTFTFWLHLKPEERNTSVLLHSQLNDLIGKSMGAEKLQMALLSVRDVNECNSGIGMCGDEADCLNEDGTYLCRCKKEYEDRSPMKSGTLCVRIPQSGIGGLFSYLEILVGTTVFFIFILVVVASSLCTILRKRPTKKACIEEPVASGTPSSAQSQLPVSSIDLSNLGDHLILDPFRPKLRAKPPEWTSQVRAHPNETYRISVEQSERL